MKKFITIVMALVAMTTVAACGQTTPEQAAVAKPKPAAPVTSTKDSDNTPDPASIDSDGDGTQDSSDFDPNDPNIQAKSDSKDCDAMGITGTHKEGLCETDGTKYKVVNHDTTLTLKQMSVRLNSVAYTSTIPVEYDNPLVGSFVVADVSITNNLNAPVNVDATDMFALGIAHKTFTPDSDATIDADSIDDSIVMEDAQPGQTLSGKVIFRVPAKTAHKMDTDGRLAVTQFSDADSYSDTAQHRVGVIRLWA